MNPSQIEAARALVACPHFRWMPGMQVVHTPMSDGQTGYCLRLSQGGYVPAANEYPDINDPATLGCLLALAREAWNAPHAHLVRVWAHVRVGTGVDLMVGTGVDLTMRREQVWALDLGNGTEPMQINMQTSEGEAIAAAILAAPVKL